MTSPADDELSAFRDAGTHPGADNSKRAASDRLGVIAIVLGCIGLVTFGFLLAIVTAVLGTIAGQQAVRNRRSPENAYIAIGLAALDGVVFLVLHYAFRLPAFAG